MIILTENAVRAVARFVSGREDRGGGVRIAVENGGCSGLQYKMSVVPKASSDDLVITEGEAQVFVDPASAQMLEGVTVDFVDSLDGSGFKFQNPNASAACSCGKSFAC
jgi:iron-sulfur cluster assembly accessory protein